MSEHTKGGETPRVKALGKDVEQIKNLSKEAAILWAAEYAQLADTLERDRDRLLAENARLRGVLRRPEFHDAFSTDTGHCIAGCPACAALSAKEGA